MEDGAPLCALRDSVADYKSAQKTLLEYEEAAQQLDMRNYDIAKQSIRLGIEV